MSKCGIADFRYGCGDGDLTVCGGVGVLANGSGPVISFVSCGEDDYVSLLLGNDGGISLYCEDGALDVLFCIDGNVEGTCNNGGGCGSGGCGGSIAFGAAGGLLTLSAAALLIKRRKEDDNK